MNRCFLAFVVSVASDVADAAECHRAALSPKMYSRVLQQAQQTAKRRIDEKSGFACRYSGEDPRVYFYTLREPQPDGSLRWEYLDCAPEKSGDWKCDAYDERALPLRKIPGVPAVDVGLPLDVDSVTAIRLVSSAYAQLGGLTQADACDSNRPPASDVAKMIMAYRSTTDSELVLSHEFGNNAVFKLDRDRFSLRLASDDVSHTVRVRCWRESDGSEELE